MARTQLEQVLGEIARLSPEEKTELVHALPIILRSGARDSCLTLERLEEIHDAWQEMRSELRSQGRKFGSISDDVEMMREERDAEILEGSSGR